MSRNTELPPGLVEVVDRTFLTHVLTRLEDNLNSTDDEVFSMLFDVQQLATRAELPQSYRDAYAGIAGLLRPIKEAIEHGLSACRESDVIRNPFSEIDGTDQASSDTLVAIARHHIVEINSAEASLLQKAEEAQLALKSRHPDVFFDWEEFPSSYHVSVVIDPGSTRECYANRDDGLLQLHMREYTPFLTPGDDRESFVPGDGHPLQGCRMGRLVQSLVGPSPIEYRSVDEHSPLPWQLLPLLHKVEVQVLSTTDKTLWIHGFGDVTKPIDLSCGCTFDGKAFHLHGRPA
jgi:hypothetical protein